MRRGISTMLEQRETNGATIESELGAVVHSRETHGVETSSSPSMKGGNEEVDEFSGLFSESRSRS
jgi:hypothetical protein